MQRTMNERPAPPPDPGPAEDFEAALGARRTGWMAIHGPAGAGKSALLSRLLAGRGRGGRTGPSAVVLRASPLGDEDLLEDLRRAVLDALGEIPRPRVPGVLPDPGGAPGWREILLGLATRAVPAGRPLVLALDGWDEMVGARRRLPAELAEALEEGRRRGPPLLVVLTLRGEADAPELAALPEPLARVRLGPLSLREAARAQGGRGARDAFLRWACLGALPAQLPPGDPGETWEEAVMKRVLHPRGDLHDAPLARVRSAFRRPARYGSLLRALALGPMEWGWVLRETRGIRTGGQLAPYLQRLEAEGLVVSERPLEAPEDARSRRYRLADPFWAFWMSCVLPARSALLAADPAEVWRKRVLPALPAHLSRWLPLAVREWLGTHAQEVLPAPAREVGGLWGGEAAFDAVAWLTNGQICYVEAPWEEGVAEAALYDDLRARMTETRHGIGREARAPVLVVPGRAHEELRRRVARDPLARLLDLSDLMGRASET
jgi:hypothetical protein